MPATPKRNLIVAAAAGAAALAMIGVAYAAVPRDFAFCRATGDDRLLACRVEMAGMQVIDSEEADVLELGRQYLIRKHADEQIALLEARLRGVAL